MHDVRSHALKEIGNVAKDFGCAGQQLAEPWCIRVGIGDRRDFRFSDCSDGSYVLQSHFAAANQTYPEGSRRREHGCRITHELMLEPTVGESLKPIFPL